MKVIQIDNFGRDYRPDFQITVAGLSKRLCKAIAEDLNARYGGDDSPYDFKVVEDDYKLSYEDLDDCNGETKDRDSFLRSRSYLGLPKAAQDLLYEEYLKEFRSLPTT